MKDLIEALNTAHELDEGRRKQVKKSDVIKYLRSHQEVKLSKEDFDYIVDDLWNAICVEIRDGADYETIEDVNMGELMDAADNPTHDLCMRLLGFMDDEDAEDDDNEDEEQSDGNVFMLDKDTAKGMTSLTIPNGTTEIGNNEFKGWNITTVYIPDSVTTIGRYAFAYWECLTAVKISSGVTGIGQSAFCGCINLTSINIPDSVNTIGSWAFERCKKLSSITIPDSVTTIGEDAFVYCSSVTIHCSKGSYAHKYALENNIPVKLI